MSRLIFCLLVIMLAASTFAQETQCSGVSEVCDWSRPCCTGLSCTSYDEEQICVDISEDLPPSDSETFECAQHSEECRNDSDCCDDSKCIAYDDKYQQCEESRWEQEE